MCLGGYGKVESLACIWIDGEGVVTDRPDISAPLMVNSEVQWFQKE